MVKSMPETDAEGDFYFIDCPSCNEEMVIFCRDNSMCMAFCGLCHSVNPIADNEFDEDGFQHSMWGMISFN